MKPLRRYLFVVALLVLNAQVAALFAMAAGCGTAGLGATRGGHECCPRAQPQPPCAACVRTGDRAPQDARACIGCATGHKSAVAWVFGPVGLLPVLSSVPEPPVAAEHIAAMATDHHDFTRLPLSPPPRA